MKKVYTKFFMKGELGSYFHNLGEHAVVLDNDISDELTFVNSLCNRWGSKVFFKVKKGAFDIGFNDIFWYEKELSNNERDFWLKKGDEAMKTFYSIVEEVVPSSEY